MRSSFFLILLFTYFFSIPAFTQWEAAAGYSVKNQYPFNGLAFHLERRLPYQGAGMGLNIRAGIEYFSADEKTFAGKEFFIKTYNSNIDLNIILNFFYRYIKPYAGAGIGAGNYSAERSGVTAGEISINRVERWKLSTKLFTGIKLIISEIIQPFFQLHVVKYFGSLEEMQFNREIKSAQLGGTAGLNFMLF